MLNPKEIQIVDYDYPLPDERIAKYPLPQRDASKLLVYNRGKISEAVFRQLPDVLPENSLLVFNNTRVIRARLLFRKATGAQVEVFCLEPVKPNDYALVFQQTEQCTWKCLIGNLKRWKGGLLEQTIRVGSESIVLRAERTASDGDDCFVTFCWEHAGITFADILDAAGVLPIPPYLHRETEISDLQTYQTVYARVKGSVAAPTAGLHFTPEVFQALDAKGIGREEITLHVGAGTFKPVKTATLAGHRMHTEYFSVHRQTIVRLLECADHVIAVGTTSVRTLESLYYIGVQLYNNPLSGEEALSVAQWAPYKKAISSPISTTEALQRILRFMDEQATDCLTASTRLLIAPGYTFRIVRGMVTNFHQPQSTLLLLVSAFVKGNWKSIYHYALTHGFRFLSYGDASLLLADIS